MDSAYDVPDATDWLSTPLKDFADVENALHCQICKEFYDTPMITSCAHTFCSKCIRTSLSTDGKCPACRGADQASKLRNNWAIQEVVTTFLAARKPTLQVARRLQEEETLTSGQRKRKRTHPSETENGHGGEASGRTTRSKSRKIAESQGSQTEAIEIEDTDNDGDFRPEDDVDGFPEDGLVECPLGCGKRMKIEAVEPHLDRCEDEKEQEKRLKSRTVVNGFKDSKNPITNGSRPLERISEFNYSMLGPSSMTKKMKEAGVPSWGSKQQIINRHREWVNIWNANCDSSNPRTKRELLQELDVWERTQGGKAPNVNGLSNSIMRKDFDGTGWAKKNQDDFSRLIADAKRKKHHPAMQPEPTKNGDITDERAAVELSPPNSTNSQPYADKPAALSSTRQKVDAVNSEQTLESAMNAGFDRSIPPPSVPTIDDPAPTDTIQSEETTRETPSAPSNPPTDLSVEGSRRVPMFAVPEQAFRDMDGAGGGGEKG